MEARHEELPKNIEETIREICTIVMEVVNPKAIDWCIEKLGKKVKEMKEMVSRGELPE